MAHLNRKLAPEVDTVFLMTGLEHAYLSSSLVREIAAFGGDVSGLVPRGRARAPRRERTGARRPHDLAIGPPRGAGRGSVYDMLSSAAPRESPPSTSCSSSNAWMPSSSRAAACP